MSCSIETKLNKISRRACKLKDSHENQEQYDQTLMDLYSFLAHRVPHDGKDNPLKILDAGCAYGTFAAYLSYKGHKVYALDAMPELHSKSLFSRRGIEFAKVNLETDPIPFENLDRIYFTEVIEHLNYNPVPVIEKFYKALKPGGQIVCTTPKKELQGIYHPIDGRYANYSHYRDIPYPWNGYQFLDNHHYFFGRSELTQLFHEVGFKVMDVFDIRAGTTHYLIATKK